ncbi:MAG: hypothetical protein V7636_2491 [Actinomycetota bacterium]|jgi:4-hydroxybenzoate polyprenyltransferase
MASRWPDDERRLRERRSLHRQLIVIVGLLILMPIAIATHNRLFGALVVAAVAVVTIYLRVQTHGIAFPRRRR